MKIKKIIFLILFILIIVAIPTLSKAEIKDKWELEPDASTGNPIDNPGAYNPEYREDLTSDDDITLVTSKANKIVSSITIVGIVVSAVTMIILGIKYMISSVEEKAEYKKSMIPYLIGAVLLLSTSTVVNLIANLINNINF